MRKVLVFSLLLIVGLTSSQVIPAMNWFDADSYQHTVRLITMFLLGFIMIHVGYEFDLDKTYPRQYAWDYIVAATAAGFPWIFCAFYFVFVLTAPEFWGDFDVWKKSLLEARFASPTSAGILFSMLAAAGLSMTWVFQKARVLAIFDDVDTVLFMVPLQMMMMGLKWQLGIVVVVLLLLLWAAWKYLHLWKIPISWPWVAFYSLAIVVACEFAYLLSGVIDPEVPVHFEVLLPAFVLGCMIARPHAAEHSEEFEAREARMMTLIAGGFMVFVGLSMPNIAEFSGGPDWPGWGIVLGHVLLITLLANLGKMFPIFCYRTEAPLRERLALCIGMWPRGEVGAGVLVVSISFGITGVPLTVAMLSLALNLVLTGVFIVFVKRLLLKVPQRPTNSPVVA